MKLNKLQRSIRIAGLVFTMVFGFIALSATTASAQYRDDRQDDNQNNRRDDRNRNDRDRNDRDDDDDDRNDNDRDYNNRNNRNNSVIQQAYREGMRQGIDDARSGYRANANRAAGQAMRQMNNGNNSRWGNQRHFRQTYRDAFIRGYQEGYNRSDRRNNRNRRNGY